MTPERNVSPADAGTEASLYGQFDAMIEALLGPPLPPAANPPEPADPAAS